MTTDVIIDPEEGKIYWNSGGNDQSIAISGNASDEIRIIGYNATYSPGSEPGGAQSRVIFKDSTSSTLIPGSQGNDLGDSDFRWKLYATSGSFSGTLTVTDTTETSDKSTGSLVLSGGIGIAKAAFIGSTLYFDNTGSNKIGIKSPSNPTAALVYTLPQRPPSATGTSVLTSTDAGFMSWIPFRLPTTKSISILKPQLDDDITLFHLDSAATITKLRGVVRGISTPKVHFYVRYGADRSAIGTTVVSIGSTLDNVNTGNEFTTFNNATPSANNFVWMIISGISGIVTEFHLTVTYN